MAAPTNYIMTVHPTEDDAINNTNALEVVGGSTVGVKNLLNKNSSTSATSGYYTHVPFFYRITSAQPCIKFYVDWDDGEDNDRLGEANYSEKTFEVPENVAIFEHTYNKHGPFYPKLTITNELGFESKYYTPSIGALSGIAQVNRITCVGSSALNKKFFQIYDGDDQGYHVWFDVGGGNTVVVPEGFISTEVAITNDSQTATQVAAAVASVLNGLSAFSASNSSSSTVTVTNAVKGNCRYPRMGTSGFSSTEPAVDGWGMKDIYTSIDSIAPSAPRETVGFIEVDSTSSPRIPVLCPANVPPVAVIAADRNEVYAGIDNEFLDGGNYLLYLYLDGKDSYDAGITTVNSISLRSADPTGNKIDNMVEITWKDQTGLIHKETKSVASAASVAGAVVGTAGSLYVKEILEVKLLNLLEATSSTVNSRLFVYERVHALIYDQTGSPTLPIGNPGSGSETAFQISLGNPHLKTDISKYTVTLDGSQSYTRNSNVSIKKYYFDVSKISQGNTVSNISDVNQVSDVLSFAGDEYPTRKVSYSFDSSHGDQFDEHLRYFSTERLIRLQVQDNSEDTKVDSNDAITFSDLSYPYAEVLTQTGFPDFIKYDSAMLYFNGGHASPVWQDVASANLTNNTVIFGGAKDGQTSLENDGPSTETANCFLLLVKDEPFNKIYFRMDNKGADWGDSLLGTDDMQQLKTSIWYGTTEVSATSNGWKPLKFNDSTGIFKGRNGTSGPDNDGVDGLTRSLSTSGSLTFDMPLDWEKTTPYTVAETDALDNLISTVPNTGTGDHDPDDKWAFEGFALLIGFTPNLENHNYKYALRAHPYNNSWSKSIKVIDPMHISLNHVGITQSVSYVRAGTHNIMIDKFGKAEIRKIGAQGGAVTFGITELSEAHGVLINKFQKNSTPVYFDIERLNGHFIRFYGVITRISEDHPTGKQFSKIGITLQTEHVIEFASNGSWTKSIALGGSIEDESKFSS
mgnify:FL=1|tara:strand:- start:1253 stop:4165 length:2913 start_codon:yes stop_codon:yes gene_type:complete